MIDKEKIRKELKCKIFPINTLGTYKYVVVCSHYEGKWVLSKHKSRNTWETQGGHIEDGETPIECARRELFEESGISDAEIYPVCDYLGYNSVSSANGMVFLAIVHSLGKMPDSEMKEISAFDTLPDNLTYPETSPLLYREAKKLLDFLGDSKETLIDSVYSTLESKCLEIMNKLTPAHPGVSFGWYNGHYHKNQRKEWVREAYPIPVIELKGVCDIEVSLDKITVSTKLNRADAINFDFNKFEGYKFEAYGVNDYLKDFYTEDCTFEDMKNSIISSTEEEIGFSVSFPFGVSITKVSRLVDLILNEKFYY